MNDPEYLSGRVVARDRRPGDVRSSNTKFVDIVPATSDYTNLAAVSLRATRDISQGEEPFVDQGRKCQFKEKYER